MPIPEWATREVDELHRLYPCRLPVTLWDDKIPFLKNILRRCKLGGWYARDGRGHHLLVFYSHPDLNRDTLREILAHEYCHALQEEREPMDRVRGKTDERVKRDEHEADKFGKNWRYRRKPA